jgi:predicted transcriptional regulator
MSTLTLNLPDDLVATLQGRSDLDQFAAEAFAEKLKEDSLTSYDKETLQQSAREIERGDMFTSSEVKLWMDEQKTQWRDAKKVASASN